MLNYIKGDLFDALDNITELTLCPHVVNDIKLFGKGFAAGVAKHYPKVREQFMLWTPHLGDTQFVIAKHNLDFANMFAQHGVVGRDNPKPIKYLALANAMGNIYSGRFGQHFNIKCIKFGSGLAKGRWDFIEELINEIWSDIPVEVYEL